MSSQKFPRKRYETPMHPWKESRIKSERELIKKYGLKTPCKNRNGKSTSKKRKRPVTNSFNPHGYPFYGSIS